MTTTVVSASKGTEATPTSHGFISSLTFCLDNWIIKLTLLSVHVCLKKITWIYMWINSWQRIFYRPANWLISLWVQPLKAALVQLLLLRFVGNKWENNILTSQFFFQNLNKIKIPLFTFFSPYFMNWTEHKHCVSRALLSVIPRQGND